MKKHLSILSFALIPIIVYAGDQAIMQDGAISANWVMTIILGLLAFLLIRMLNKMDKRADSHSTDLKAHNAKIIEHGIRLDVHDEKFAKIV